MGHASEVHKDMLQNWTIDILWWNGWTFNCNDHDHMTHDHDHDHAYFGTVSDGFTASEVHKGDCKTGFIA